MHKAMPEKCQWIHSAPTFTHSKKHAKRERVSRLDIYLGAARSPVWKDVVDTSHGWAGREESGETLQVGRTHRSQCREAASR